MKRLLKNLAITLLIPLVSFVAAIYIQKAFQAASLIPMIFVLAVFLTSLTTDGVIWGILASMLGVLAVNYAFAFPFFKFNFSIPANSFSALVMLIVATITSMLTTKIKYQERLRVETEKERIRANLLRAISHDLRTPLTSIYGSTSAILENYDQLTDARKQKLLCQVQEDSAWLIRMVENLLSITRVGGDGVRLVKSPTVLEELTDTVLTKFRKSHPQQLVSVDIPDHFISIPMDAMLIEQVILNVMENAVYHAAGMTTLLFRVYTKGGLAVFEISDDGCGVAPNKLDRLFTGYGQGETGPSDGNTRGMGIGLSVCAAIIKAHNGDIQAENRETHGLTIRFTLEMEAAHGQ